MDANGWLLVPMDDYWCLWMPVETNEWLLVSIDGCWYLWVAIGYWCLWMAVGDYGWLLVTMDGYWCCNKFLSNEVIFVTIHHHPLMSSHSSKDILKVQIRLRSFFYKISRVLYPVLTIFERKTGNSVNGYCFEFSNCKIIPNLVMNISRFLKSYLLDNDCNIKRQVIAILKRETSSNFFS